MHAANIVSALTPTQISAMNAIEAQATTAPAEAQAALDALLAKTFSMSQAHAIRLQASLFLK